MLLLLAAAAAAAETIDLTKKAKIQSIWKQQLELYGSNCPVPLTLTDSGEDARGEIFRFECVSISGKNRWSLRLIIGPNGVRRAEPW